MKVKQLKQDLQNLFNQGMNAYKLADDSFHKLQDLARKNHMTVWCSAIDNFTQLYSSSEVSKEDKDEALKQYISYERLNQQYNDFSEVGTAMAKADFWKERD